MQLSTSSPTTITLDSCVILTTFTLLYSHISLFATAIGTIMPHRPTTTSFLHYRYLATTNKAAQSYIHP